MAQKDKADKAWISAKIKKLMDEEKMTQRQAVAIAISMAKKRQPKRKGK